MCTYWQQVRIVTLYNQIFFRCSFFDWVTDKYSNWKPEVMTPRSKIQYFLCLCFSSLQSAGVPKKACLTNGVGAGKRQALKRSKSIFCPNKFEAERDDAVV